MSHKLTLSHFFRGDNMAYVKYAWVGNQISPDDMAKLHHIKETTRTPITCMVAEAVKEYVKGR